MEKIFRMQIKRHLHERIKGDISVHVIDDTLIIDINPLGLKPFHYIIKNIAVQMSIGVSSKIVSDVIVKQYKNYILKQYFI